MLTSALSAAHLLLRKGFGFCFKAETPVSVSGPGARAPTACWCRDSPVVQSRQAPAPPPAGKGWPSASSSCTPATLAGPSPSTLLQPPAHPRVRSSAEIPCERPRGCPAPSSWGVPGTLGKFLRRSAAAFRHAPRTRHSAGSAAPHQACTQPAREPACFFLLVKSSRK